MLRYPAGTSVAVGDAAEIQIPLDRRAALSMGAVGRGDQLVPGSAKIAADLNQAVANNARRFLFHHPSDEPLAGVALHQPRPRELSSPEAAAILASSHWD
jgi:hypothetical protein